MQREKQYSAKSIQILPGNPTATAIHQILTWALENLDKQVEVIWPSSKKGSEYKLTAHADPMGGDPKWVLNVAGAGESKLIWEFTSCDSLLVFNRIEASLNEREGTTRVSNQVIGTKEEKAEENAFFYVPEAVTKQRSTIPIPMVGQESSLNRTSTVLNGDLAFVQISALLQSIALAKMTGRLEIDSEEGGAAEVFFTDGQPIHATSPGLEGPECVYELVTWKEGRFFFQPKVQTKSKTISDNLDSLMIQGAQLFDKFQYLKNMSFKTDCVLVKTQHNLDDAALKKILAPAIPVAFAPQRKFFDAIDDRMTAEELIKKLELKKSAWVPIICNMLSCGLAAFTKPSKKGTLPPLEPKAVDSAAIQSVIMSLRRGDTGMFNFPAFLYFLEQEYFRGHRSGSPISVIVFEMRVKSGPNAAIREPLPIGALREAVLRISQTKRHNDLLAHYEAFDYALLCPDTKGEGARIFANRIMQALLKAPLATGVDARTLSVAFGAACVPEDFLELGLLLSAAEAGKASALLTPDAPVVLYRDLLNKD